MPLLLVLPMVEVLVVLKRVIIYLQRKPLNAPPPKMFRHVHADECKRKKILSPNTAFDLNFVNHIMLVKQIFFLVASSLNGDQFQTSTSHSPMELVQLCQDIPLRLGQCLGNSSSLDKLVNSIQIGKFYILRHISHVLYPLSQL